MMIFIEKLVGQLWVLFLFSTYAKLRMEYFDTHLYNICRLKWGKEFQEFILETWRFFYI